MAIRQRRYVDSRNPDSVRAGLAFERFIAEEFHRRGWAYTPTVTEADQIALGDAREGIEVKFDDRCSMTGRIAIEVAERRNLRHDWIASGIYASSSAIWYVQGNYHEAYVFRRDDLRNFFTEEQPETCNTNPPTSQYFFMSLRKARSLAVATIKPIEPWERDENGVWKEWTGCGRYNND